MANSTTTSTTGYVDEAKQNKILDDAQNLYDTGQLGNVAGFTQAQLDAQKAGIAAGNVQTGLEGQLAGMAGKTDLSGMRQGAQNQALQALGLNSAAAGRMGGLGGSRQFINQQSIANDLAGKFGQIDQQQQQMDVAGLQAALTAQGTGAGQMAQIGQAQQQQQQNVNDAGYTGLTQLGEMFSNIASKKTSSSADTGGK
uniref:Uncharacterized protein n=1 Tax=Virus NIOZ-UU157 TaxID=2763269 RepID=A0A7S9SU52_9VIRU|nr:MAG: hypothetical protein NIOZUU157_00201 [Virus NIOZ-UU157]